MRRNSFSPAHASSNLSTGSVQPQFRQQSALIARLDFQKIKNAQGNSREHGFGSAKSFDQINDAGRIGEQEDPRKSMGDFRGTQRHSSTPFFCGHLQGYAWRVTD